MMLNKLIITGGKVLAILSQKANLGNGSTWPGHLALKGNKNFIQDLLKQSKIKIIFVVGTNGKTTTTSLLSHILRTNGANVIQNTAGANLINGIASTLLLATSYTGRLKADVAIFEIDENAFPAVSDVVSPDIVIILNLFRDQLDRYGEVNTIALKWHQTLIKIPKTTQLFLNADDPQIAFLGSNARQTVRYFGLDEKGRIEAKIDHSSDSTYCPNCGEKLAYSKLFYSHLGIWKCPKCTFTHPKDTSTDSPLYPLDGLYNKSNTNAVTLVASVLGYSKEAIQNSLLTFSPVFGRQEKLTVNGKSVEVILAKNPTGFNQALETVLSHKATHLLLALNDNAADGTDVSWIWDIDIELLKNPAMQVTLTGSRVYDLALRLKYAGITKNVIIEEDLSLALQKSLSRLESSSVLYILPTYTAMLAIRKILTGKKIL